MKISDIKDITPIKALETVINSPTADLLGTLADCLHAVPFGSIAQSAIKIGIDFRNYLFIKKFSAFLVPLSGKEDEANAYVNALSKKELERISEYLTSLLANADSTEKARIMGFIFKAAVRKSINEEMMLRLVSIVGRAFVSDLKSLPTFKDPSEEFSIAANEFVNLGLINNDPGGYWRNSPTLQLNGIGATLCTILENEGWFD